MVGVACTAIQRCLCFFVFPESYSTSSLCAICKDSDKTVQVCQSLPDADPGFLKKGFVYMYKWVGVRFVTLSHFS